MMNSDNTTNITVNNSTTIKALSDEESFFLNPLKILYVAIPSLLISVAFILVIYIIRKKKIMKVETAKAEKSIDEIMRSIIN